MRESEFMGGTQDLSPSANFAIDFRVGKVVMVDAGAGLTGTLIDARKLRSGGWQGFVVNVGSNSFDVDDAAAGTVVTVSAGEVSMLVLGDNSTAAGEWGGRTKARLA